MEHPFPGGRDCIRQAFLERRVPPKALEAMLASLADSTVAQYSKPLHLWWTFCRTSAIPVFSPSPTQFISFLAQQLAVTHSYSAINTIRSAVSLVSHNEIGSHRLVRRFCRGVGNLRPPRPRYEYVWDPAIVIARLAQLYPHESLPLEAITRKLVLLLALGTGQRSQTLASIRLSQIALNDNKLLIRVPDKLKTSAPGRPQPCFSFSPFEGHDNLCIYNLTRHYLSRTEKLRSPACDSLFISFVRPHRAVVSQTISRWLRFSLEECGVRSDFFAPHSTRHASTSRAAQKGVSIEIIKRAARWSGQSRVFANFYNHPIIDPEAFSTAVLRP